MSHDKIKGLYAITDPLLIKDALLYDAVSQAIDGGISVLQYRNKIASYDLQLQQASLLKDLCQKNQITFIINDHIDLAKQVSADGVHLGKSDQNIVLAREELGKNAIIGLSCYNCLDKAIEAQQQGVDYIAFGRFFPSKTKPDAVQADLQLLLKAKQKIHLPIVAIGGVSKNNVALLTHNGANSVAVINAIFAQENIFMATREIVTNI